MEPVDLSVGGSGSVSADLGTHLSAKKNYLNTVYSCDTSYKKPKKHVAGIVVDLSASPLSLEDIDGAGVKPMVSWSSKVGSIASSISNLLDVKNMMNTVAEKTSYVESGKDNGMDKATPRKTHT
ncbi:hypothetical protein G9A89_021229 [Geosiphon pyriformis]|nr:hypothetical protein G9A89_021229 [Geosiphon pyriformis]